MRQRDHNPSDTTLSHRSCVMKVILLTTLSLSLHLVSGYDPQIPSRRQVLLTTASSATALVGGASSATAVQDSLDIDTFLRTGVDAGGGMTVSSQAGKSRPVTGVVLRDGSEISQDTRSGQVSAEILTGTKENLKAVLVSFDSPKLKLETGPVFDVECRDGKTGDGVFLAVTQTTAGKSLEQLPSSFFLERLFEPTGRFSFYGPPTDIKVKKSAVEGNRRLIEVSFSNLSQSTNAEIPRKALLVATIPEGSENAVMLVGSANASRFQRDAQATLRHAVESFRAVPAPKTNLKLRPKPQGNELVQF